MKRQPGKTGSSMIYSRGCNKLLITKWKHFKEVFRLPLCKRNSSVIWLFRLIIIFILACCGLFVGLLFLLFFFCLFVHLYNCEVNLTLSTKLYTCVRTLNLVLFLQSQKYLVIFLQTASGMIVVDNLKLHQTLLLAIHQCYQDFHYSFLFKS